MATSTHTCDLILPPSVPHLAKRAHIFPNFPGAALISVGTLCDEGCTVHFNTANLIVVCDGAIILTGTRTNASGLWIVNASPRRSATITPQPAHHTAPPVCNSLARPCPPLATLEQRIAFLHASMCNPALSTLCSAIDAGFLSSFLEITSALVRKYPPQSAAMVQGHLDQVRRNTASTQPSPNVVTATPSPTTPPVLADTATTPPPLCTGARSHVLYTFCIPATGQVFTDQTGRFPHKLTAGNTDMLVLYDYDSNYIHVEAMPSRTGYQILLAYQRAHDLLKSRGLRPRLQKLDNEASRTLIHFLDVEDVDFQLCPPHIHRHNAAERAIHTFKNHFIATLCGTDPGFNLALWDCLLPQALLTLNLLRASHLNPNLSAYAQLYGSFDFNRTPLAPPGTKVMVHEKPAQQGTWAPHAVAGWYLRPAIHHYRCYRVWINATRAERIADTLAWFPTKVVMPVPSMGKRAIAAARDLTNIL